MNRIGEKDRDKVRSKLKSLEFKEIFLVIREGRDYFLKSLVQGS
jgi:hypothetical protein